MDLRTEIERLRSEGFSYKEISKSLGCSKGTIAYHVGPGQKEKTLKKRSLRANSFRRFVQQSKEGKACTDCGEEYPYFVLDFDHRLGESKTDNISRIGSFNSIEALRKEIEKCDIVCANCHRIRTWNRQTK